MAAEGESIFSGMSSLVGYSIMVCVCVFLSNNNNYRKRGHEFEGSGQYNEL